MCDLLAANQRVKNATVEVIATQSGDELASENTTVQFIAYALAHRVPKVFVYLVLLRIQTLTVAARVAYCVIVSQFGTKNTTRQDKTRLVNLYYNEVVPIAELKIWASCADQ